MKKLFKKQSIIDTAVNVGIGGGANVLIDTVVANVDMLASAKPLYINLGKIALGAFAGTMISNKYARAAADGVATVGAANLVKDLVDGTTDGGSGNDTTSGLPFGTIGKVKLGNKAYKRRVSGVGANTYSFMQP